MRKMSVVSMVLLICFAFAATARADLVAYYSFDSGATNGSSYGGLYDGTVFGATLSSQGYSGGSYTFDGDDYIRASVNINPSNYPQLTMGAWVNATDASSIRRILSHDDGGFDRSLGIDNRFPAPAPYWSAFTGPATGMIVGSSATTGAWTFVAVSYDQETGQAMLYVDGVVVSTSGSSLGEGLDYISIGSSPSFGKYFMGSIDEVFIYNEALSAAQLDEIRSNGISAPVINETRAIIASPEPAALLLLGVGLLGLAGARRAGA